MDRSRSDRTTDAVPAAHQNGLQRETELVRVGLLTGTTSENLFALFIYLIAKSILCIETISEVRTYSEMEDTKPSLVAITKVRDIPIIPIERPFTVPSFMPFLTQKP